MDKLIAYYEQAVVRENNLICSHNDELGSLNMSTDGMHEIEEFENNISLKQNTVRAKLEKTRRAKLQKLLCPEIQQSDDRTNTKQPNLNKRQQKKKQKNKRKQRKKQKRVQNSDKNPDDKDKDHSRHKPDSGPTYRNNNRRNRPYQPCWYLKDRYYRPNWRDNYDPDRRW